MLNTQYALLNKNGKFKRSKKSNYLGQLYAADYQSDEDGFRGKVETCDQRNRSVASVRQQVA